jgi:hypothetical protein
MIAIGICCAGVLTAIILGGLMWWVWVTRAPVVTVGDDVLVTTLAGRVVRVDGDWLLLRMSSDRHSPLVRVLASSVVRRWKAER